VLASSSFPGFLTPIRIEGDLWTDGGVRNVTPIGDAIRLGATSIDVILCSPDKETSKPWKTDGQSAVPGYLTRAIEMLSDEVTRGDLREAGLKNDLAELRPKYKKVSLRVFMPREPLPGTSLAFEQPEIRARFELGRSVGLAT
jgi:predicted patatin/cPLA2 family phospholipase